MTTPPPWPADRVERRPLVALIPYARNARTHTPEQIEQLCNSIREWGWTIPVLIDPEGEIIAGHARVQAAAKLGFSEVPCMTAHGWSEAQKRAYVLADNQLALNAGWDEALLAEELAELQTLDFDLDRLGFDPGELDAYLAGAGLGASPTETEGDTEPEIDRSEELRAKWGVEPGQLWQLGAHRLLCGDSGIAGDVERLMGGGRADMLITDPPYGVAYVGKTKDALTLENDDVSEEKLSALCKLWFDGAMNATRPGAYWVATVPSGPLHAVFLNDWKERGVLRQVLVWNKDSMVLGHSEYHYKHEPILFGWVPGKRLINADRTKTTVWDFARPKASKDHPTMKPVAMWEYAISNHTQAGDCVYEPFSGSGTTLIAGENLGRKVRAIEISPAYVAVALQRWADHTGRQPQLISTQNPVCPGNA